MKRFCILLLAVAVVLVPLPMGAMAVVERPDLYESMKAALEAELARTDIPDDFTYYIVQAHISNDRVSFIFSFFNTPAVEANAISYINVGGTYVRCTETTFLRHTTGRPTIRFVRPTGGSPVTVSTTHIVIDWSTAAFYNQDAVLNSLDYDAWLEIGFEPEPEPDPVDTTELVELIEEAEAIEDIGYTFVSWSRLHTAIASGKSLLASASYTQPQVDTASSNLRTAMNSLVIAEPVGPPPDPGEHRYLVDGFTVSDLFPAQQAIMENLTAGRWYAIWIFITIFGVCLLPRLIRMIIAPEFWFRNVERYSGDSSPRGGPSKPGQSIGKGGKGS